MKEIQGDIWHYYDKGHWIAITTNGVLRFDGAAVMGRGVARQAKDRFPQLPFSLGKLLRRYGNVPQLLLDFRIVTFPVKYHWLDKANPDLIRESCQRLLAGMKPWGLAELYLVRPGCGNGGLAWADVRPILAEYLDDRFIVVQIGSSG